MVPWALEPSKQMLPKEGKCQMHKHVAEENTLSNQAPVCRSRSSVLDKNEAMGGNGVLKGKL